eukprot:TRINITY_DN26604_c0_g1_i1.p2 TRINITY_DN26604_c0_g1~~TRINITY_DN26604_c0_g1_i1.p2  ORF type:complete len:114 (-),score=2.33 TRINITY_DN26604_c0_g1_i1:16-357(-)
MGSNNSLLISESTDTCVFQKNLKEVLVILLEDAPGTNILLEIINRRIQPKPGPQNQHNTSHPESEPDLHLAPGGLGELVLEDRDEHERRRDEREIHLIRTQVSRINNDNNNEG